ncbi:MAG: class I SAM-dependent methyltransferase family protein [Thermodesulfobacteriota bacterium]
MPIERKRRLNGMRNKMIPTFEELLKPLPYYSPKKWYYDLFSLFLRTFGNTSEGISTGFKYGFDSGMIMNYVYNNLPKGKFLIGKKIDSAFLNQITCKAFRSIKETQKNKIKNYIEQRGGNSTFIVDLASGKADYIYDVLRETNADIKVLLRDINEKALIESLNLANKLNLQEIVSFQVGNAFDIESLKQISPKPNLVIEVGLYGIIHDDELIKIHLKQINNTLNPDAILFNVQTYNPQIELIARVLKNQAGERCVWHLRPVENLVNWAEDAGFSEPNVTMDPYGIYAVVMMKKCS